jgi:lipoprotein-anchoring transpeptidase ErfK/SrfK
VHQIFHFAAATALISCSCVAAAAEKSTAAKKGKRGPAEIEAATRLQIFLDRANFGPGKLDGYYGDFTRKALALYRESQRREAPATTAADAPPDTSGLDLATVDPVFITYMITDADQQSVGELPADLAEKAKLKALPYASLAEAVAEKFHCDVDFLEELNPGKTKELKIGDELKVPNVEPFDLAAVKDLKPGSEIGPAVANEIPEEPAAQRDESADEKAGKTDPAAAATTSVRVDTTTNMLSVYQGDTIVAAYPVSIGSERTASPIGEWTVRGVAKMPTFRHDEKMLNEGERSDDFKMLAPGPNNPVGVIWIALNKKGIGLHGMDDPDAIGRSASHGCVRLANWDVVRLAGKVKGGVAVSIH